MSEQIDDPPPGEELPGCGPGGRGFESRRSPLTNSLQNGIIGRSQEGAQSATGSNSGSNLGFEQGSSEGPDDPPPRPRLLGDEAELFASYSQRLRRIVQRLVNTSPDIVDDACNYAWMEFIRCQPDRDGGWRAWLVTTAQREAWRLDGKERGHFGFEVEGLGEGLVREAADPRDVVAIRAELRFALDVFATVPERRREVKALAVMEGSTNELTAAFRGCRSEGAGIARRCTTPHRPQHEWFGVGRDARS